MGNGVVCPPLVMNEVESILLWDQLMLDGYWVDRVRVVGISCLRRESWRDLLQRYRWDRRFEVEGPVQLDGNILLYQQCEWFVFLVQNMWHTGSVSRPVQYTKHQYHGDSKTCDYWVFRGLKLSYQVGLAGCGWNRKDRVKQSMLKVLGCIGNFGGGWGWVLLGVIAHPIRWLESLGLLCTMSWWNGPWRFKLPVQPRFVDVHAVVQADSRCCSWVALI